jgi:hypothetical protein
MFLTERREALRVLEFISLAICVDNHNISYTIFHENAKCQLFARGFSLHSAIGGIAAPVSGNLGAWWGILL